MVGRFTLRCPELDAYGLEGWERPDGTTALLRRGAQLVRLRNTRGQPIVVQRRTRAG